ncbi:MAG TPA: c-type cytochrome [Vicinamibacteria bacterium]|jgi:mono/diheme cytochrome c family protein
MLRILGHNFVILTALGTMAWSGPQSVGDPASKWEAPADARAHPNPVAPSQDVLAEGKALYQRNCQLCHGASGRGDGPATQYVKPAPADISTAEAQAAMTDGEMFWKLTTGREPMPPFGKKLNERERWVLVHYVRSLKVD